LKRISTAVRQLACVALVVASGCAPARFEGRRTSGDEEAYREIVVGGETRSYLLHRPTVLNAAQRPPLFIVLHGTHGNAAGIAGTTGFNRAADIRRFIVAYPNGTGFLSYLTWNTGRCCGSAMEAKANDVGFIHSMIQELVRTAKIDPRRVFVVGFSDGGMMAFRAGCDLSTEIAGLAIVAGRMPDTVCTARRALPIIAFGGTADNDLATDHDRYTTPTSFKYAFSLDSSLAYWARKSQCVATPRVEARGIHHVVSYAACVPRAPIQYYKVQDAGHEWPGGATAILQPSDSVTLPATQLIVDFLLQQRVRRRLLPGAL